MARFVYTAAEREAALYSDTVPVNQINGRVPANVRTPSSVPLFLTVGTKQSNIVTLPVQ